jgi:hypothetical protein
METSSDVMNGITAQHVREHGSESLFPNYKELIGPDLSRKPLSIPNGTIRGAMTLSWDPPSFLSFGTMAALAAGTGFCKAEAALPCGVGFDDRRLRRSSLL